MHLSGRPLAKPYRTRAFFLRIFLPACKKLVVLGHFSFQFELRFFLIWSWSIPVGASKIRCSTRAFAVSKAAVTDHSRHGNAKCEQDSKSVCEQSHMGSNPILSAKKVQQTQGFAGLSFFVRLLEFSDFRVGTALELAVFALEQRVFLVKNPGSNPVLLFCPARLHFPSGSRNHLTSEGAFPAPWPAPRIFWICSRDGHKYWRSC